MVDATSMTRRQNTFGHLLDLVERHKTNELAGTKPVEAGIAGNLERQVSFDDSHFGSFHRLGPSSPLLSGSRHGAGRGECRGQ